MDNIFNLSHDLKKPKIYLCRKDFSKIGEISYFAADISISMSFGNCDELSFTVYKSVDNNKNPYWDDIVNLKLVYIYDYDEYFEIEVGEQESASESKTITAQSLCESELSNLNVSLEVNTDLDIEKTDYTPTVIYNPSNPSASLLHRLLKDKAPHYTVSHVDSSLASLQRTFSVDNNIDDFLRQQLATEIDAYVEYNTSKRSIALYDMLSVCKSCGYRGDFQDICPKCGHRDIQQGYGEWTNVYISTDNLAEEISLTATKSTIKNCFKIVGGDDNLTNRIPSVNPNGTGYIVKFSDLQYEDMPNELTEKLKSYMLLCDNKKNEYKDITLNICDCLDKILYYQSGMMPSPSTSNTSAPKELKKVTDDLSALMSNTQAPNTIGLNTFSKFTTAALVNKAVLSYVKILLSPDYEASVASSDYSYFDTYGIWKGALHINSISYPDTDYADSTTITLKVDGNSIAYVTQKIDKALSQKDLKDQIYDYTLYSVDALQNFIDAYEACEGILVDHGDSGMGTDTPQYALYKKYRDLKEAAVTEQKRKLEIVADWTEKKENYEAQKKTINDMLNIQNYLGDKLFMLYCSYRRDDTYENSNYISDGLSDADLLKQAEKLLAVADKELEIACQNQYSLTATLNNLFLIDAFKPFHSKCRLGNWIYAEISGNVYIMRVVKIGIDYDSIDKISIEFSNVRQYFNTSKSIKDILDKSQSIAASYPSTAKQVSEDSKVISQVNHWVDNGLNATNIMIANSPVQNTVLDENGIWCRGHDEITGDFEPTQLRIVNSTLAVTDDGWETTKAAIGKYIMQDPVTGEYRYAMGVIGETIIGKLLLGENLGIYNNNLSMTFDKDGLKVTNGENTFTVNPNSNELLTISNSKQKIFYVDTAGMLHISGDGAGLDIRSNDSVKGLSNQISITAAGLEGKITSVNDNLTHEISVTADGLTSKIESTDGRVTSLSSTVNGIKTEVADKVSSSTFTQTTNNISLAIQDKVGNNEIISKINASTEGVQILGKKVDITGQVTFNSFTSGLQDSINEIGSNASDAKEKTDGLARGTTVINGGCIQTNTIDADKIVSGSLIVGKNVLMGEDAVISWENVTDKGSVITEGDDIGRLRNDAGYQTADQVTLITKNTVTTSYVNALNVKAGSVDAENITGNVINGKTINGSTLNGCAGGFTSIFMFNKDFVDTFQHGSICGQYVNDDGTIDQYEVFRINNTLMGSDVYVYTPMYFYNTNAYPIFNPITGIRFGSSMLGDNRCAYPIYINTLYNDTELSGRTGLRIGFYNPYSSESSHEDPAFELYYDSDDEYTHTISAKVFGNLEVTGIITDQSSKRYKANICELSDSIALNLLKYNIISFDYKDGRRGRHGMLAEEAAEISEYGIVRNKDNEPDAIGYTSFIPDIIKLNQIMYKEIQELKEQIAQLKGA